MAHFFLHVFDMGCMFWPFSLLDCVAYNIYYTTKPVKKRASHISPPNQKGEKINYILQINICALTMTNVSLIVITVMH